MIQSDSTQSAGCRSHTKCRNHGISPSHGSLQNNENQPDLDRWNYTQPTPSNELYTQLHETSQKLRSFFARADPYAYPVFTSRGKGPFKVINWTRLCFSSKRKSLRLIFFTKITQNFGENCGFCTKCEFMTSLANF